MLFLLGYRDNRLRKLAELGAADEDQYRSALKAILGADRGEIPFQIMLHQLGRLRGALAEASNKVARLADDFWSQTLDRHVAQNSALLGALTAFRLYVDHTETRLKRSHGPDAAVVGAFKEATAKAYDNVFAYRLFYKLRNFLQHQSIPIRLSDLVAESPNLDFVVPDRQLRPVFDVNALLEDGPDTWGGPLRAELQGLAPEIAIEPLLAPFEAAAWQVREAVVAAERPLLEPWAAVIQRLVAPAVAEGLNPIFAEPEEGGPKLRLRFLQPPEALLVSLGVTAFRLPKQGGPTAA